MASALPLRRAPSAWMDRVRVASLAQRILEVDRVLLRRAGAGVLTEEEAAVLLSLAERLGVPP
jgi:hypothetical protein